MIQFKNWVFQSRLVIYVRDFAPVMALKLSQENLLVKVYFIKKIH